MDYISVTDAADRWGISPRQVQRLLADYRIPNAIKYGRAWMIPVDAKKPQDLRWRKKNSKISFSEELRYFIEETTLPMPTKDPDTMLDRNMNERVALYYEYELAYMRGDFDKVLRGFLKVEGDDVVKLRSSHIAIAAAISLGDYDSYIKIEKYLKNHIADDPKSLAASIAKQALTTAAVSVIAPNMVSEWLREGDLCEFPLQIRPYILYLRAKYFQCIGNFESMLTVAQTTLSLCLVRQGITCTEVYLLLICAVACYSLARRDEAIHWLTQAMNTTLPHGFITPFAESITALGGLVELCLKQSFPQYYDAVINQYNITWKNWVTFHNLFTKDNITHILTLREYHIAVLAAHRVPYAEIAKQYSISVGRLKNIMQQIYGKLLVSNRSELSKYTY